jgi:hypothetical protein
MVEGTFEISQNAFDMIKVWNARIMHEQAGFLDGKGNFRTSDSEILKYTSEATVK